MTKWTKEQEQAIYKSGTNIIVSAGAGSGKTAVLTERVLEKIKNGVSIANLLILTFTRMAAKEMRTRIKDKLAKEGLTEELKLVDTADITTFDSYALSTVRKYHYYLNVSRDIGIIDASIIFLYKKKILRNIFDDLYRERDESFLLLVKTYSLKDDVELFDFILNVNSKLDLKIDKKKYLNKYLDQMFSEEKIEKDILDYTEVIIKQIDTIRDYVSLIDDATYLDKLLLVLSPLFNSHDYNAIKDNLNFILPRAVNVSEITRDAKNKISRLLDDIRKLTIYKDTNEIKKSIIENKRFVKTIIDIILKLDSKVEEYKIKNDYYEYNDIAKLAIKLVKENTDVREEIKNNLVEILIDEYQDTSDIQEEFIACISNNNVYMVGDIKQSIYRFRNANPYIFKNKYDKYSQNDTGIKIDLNKNFRSRREVIANINAIFNQIMDDELGGARYKDSHQMIFGNLMYQEEGYSSQDHNCEIYTYEDDCNYRKEEIEAFIIASDIKKKIEQEYLVFDQNKKENRKVEYRDFVVLMDNSKYFELFKKILEYHGIPTAIMKNSNLTDGEVILVIKNIICLLIKVSDNVLDMEFKKIFISLGRSFLFNIHDEVLFDYFINGNFCDSEIYQMTKDISKEINSLSLDNLIDLILDRFAFYDKLILIGNYNLNVLKIDKLKEITHCVSDLGYSIYDYAEYLNDIIDNNVKIEYQNNDTDENAVKIMTIHASKGLEFNLCYYACLHNRFNIKEATSKFSYDDMYGIILPYKDDFFYNTIYHNLSFRNYVKENIGERIRLFYVAVTRAKEKMIFLLPQKKNDNTTYSGNLVDIDIRKKYNSLASILYSLNLESRKYYKDIDLSEIGLTREYNLIKDSNYKRKINIIDTKIKVTELNVKTDKESTVSFAKQQNKLITKEDEEKLHYGLMIHKVLEFTDFKNINDDILNGKEKEIISDFLDNINIENSKNIYKEYEFVYFEEGICHHGIIDLMIEYENYINIIDYKLKNINDESYFKQLYGYKEYIKKVFKKEVRLYLYSIIDKKLERI